MYHKEQYVFKSGKPVKAVVRPYKERDFDALIGIQRASFPPPFPEELLWNKEQLANHIETYPEGALCVEVEGEMAGSITGLLTDFDAASSHHSWSEATADGSITNHNPDGKTLYIADICVSPAFRKMDLGRLLMQSYYERAVHDGLERVLGGGRIPGYSKHAAELSPEAYLAHVVSGELKDPVVSFLLRCGRTPVCVIADYLEDADSLNYAALMEWENPFKLKLQ
ncbi:MAG TPA: GNAT family N-acetyltransferase [Planococcus sp. (in: firmicutes)]|nr:GNAT family N-acetyltransferase [Planococcus sp. (in: firmicutes)]